MASENTITEQDLDANARKLVQSLRQNGSDVDPDLAVDGLSESLISRIFRLIGDSDS